MSSNRTDGAVAEYLHELELRLTGLPVLQRRELLGDLEAHITNERIERGVVSESEVLEILERLGSPEVVAAAAYEEAGLYQVPAFAGVAASRALPPVAPPPDPPSYSPPPFTAPAFTAPSFEAPPPPVKQGRGTGHVVAIAVALVSAVMVLLFCAGGAFLLQSSSADEAPVQVGVEERAVPMQPADPAEAPDAPRVEGN